MYKKLLLLLLSMSQLHGIQEKEHLLSQLPTNNVQEFLEFLDPESTAVTFDIDKVIVDNREETYTDWLQEEKHAQFAKYLEEAKKTGLFDAHALINKVVEDHPDQKILADEFKKIIITATPIKGMAELIEQLHKKGYTVLIASNMTTSTYESMVENKVLPKEFTKDYFFVQTDPLNKKSDGSYHKKPETKYYENLLVYLEAKFPGKFKIVIFTDDKLINSQGAADTGKIKAIHFITPDQFKQALQKLGVMVN